MRDPPFESVRRNLTMKKSVERSPLLQPALSSQVRVVLVLAAMGVLISPCLATDVPKADPAGIATGDKTSAVDAAGNAFAVPAPTDKNAPDYQKNKKDYDDFQSQ